MAQDISKKTVAVLLVLAIVLTVTGTWIALTTEPIIKVEGPSQGYGQVKLDVIGPPQTDTGSGKVSLTIK